MQYQTIQKDNLFSVMRFKDGKAVEIMASPDQADAEHFAGWLNASLKAAYFTPKTLPDGAVTVVPKDQGGKELHPGAVRYDGEDASEQAKRHARRLTIIKLRGERKYNLYAQDAVEFAKISPLLTEQVACGNCRWFSEYTGDWEGHCRIVRDYPEVITDMSWCNRHEVEPANTWEPTPQPVYLVDAPAEVEEGERGLDDPPPADAPATSPPTPTTEDAPAQKASPVLTALKYLVKNFNLIRSPEPVTYQPGQGFKIRPDGRFIGWWTNNAADLEDELFASKAIDNYINAVRSGEWEYPELWRGHIPGTMHGKAEALGRVGPMVYAVGAFDTSWKAQKFKQAYKTQTDMQMSHGFLYNPGLKINGVYYWFRTYEISSLQKGWAANPITLFLGGKMSHQLSEQSRADLALLGFTAAEIADIEKDGNQQAKHIADLGLRQKGSEPPVTVQTPQPPANEPTEPEVKGNAPAPVDEQQKAIDTRLSGMEKTIKDQGEVIEALRKMIAESLGYAPPASKSKATEIPPNDPHVERLLQLNEEGVGGDDPLAKFFPGFNSRTEQE